MMPCLIAPNASRSPALDDTQTLWASNTSSAVRISTNVRSISSSRFLTIDHLSCRSTLNPRCGTALLLISLATFGCLFRREGSAAGGSDILISLHAAIILSVKPDDHMVCHPKLAGVLLPAPVAFVISRSARAAKADPVSSKVLPFSVGIVDRKTGDSRHLILLVIKEIQINW
jgi:hypothetical protein